MASSDTFYLDSDNIEKLKERTKKRGDKSKIVNDALKQYFLPEQENQEKSKEEHLVNDVRVRIEA